MTHFESPNQNLIKISCLSLGVFSNLIRGHHSSYQECQPLSLSDIEASARTTPGAAREISNSDVDWFWMILVFFSSFHVISIWFYLYVWLMVTVWFYFLELRESHRLAGPGGRRCERTTARVERRMPQRPATGNGNRSEVANYYCSGNWDW